MTKQLKKEIVQHISRSLIDIQILRLIQNQPMWGYKIKNQVEKKFKVKLGHGSLYPLLKKLENKGLINSKKQRKSGRIIKMYTLSKKGKKFVDIYKKIIKDQLENKDIK
jgi:DNA-binding PadR family transcriptional regulator